ncbi:MAG TPA: RHS repeat-associated core domain-containing protein, partial [Anaerolineaceae bacterium]
MGLLDYNARFYSAYLGRFVSADSVIGNIDKTQDFDRYSYSINNPILFNDPSGHHYCESRFADPSECQGITFEEMYNIRWLNKWPAMEKQAAEKGVKEISKRLQPR